MPKKQTTETPEVKPKGADAIVSVEIQSSEGSITRMFNISGFTANTLSWQRKGPALDEMLKTALSKLGRVTLVR